MTTLNTLILSSALLNPIFLLLSEQDSTEAKLAAANEE